MVCNSFLITGGDSVKHSSVGPTRIDGKSEHLGKGLRTYTYSELPEISICTKIQNSHLKCPHQSGELQAPRRTSPIIHSRSFGFISAGEKRKAGGMDFPRETSVTGQETEAPCDYQHGRC